MDNNQRDESKCEEGMDSGEASHELSAMQKWGLVLVVVLVVAVIVFGGMMLNDSRSGSEGATQVKGGLHIVTITEDPPTSQPPYGYSSNSTLTFKLELF